MKFLPLQDRILVRRSDGVKQSEGGILLPEEEQQDRGEVIAKGPGKRLEDGTYAAVDVSIGNVVCFGKYAGTQVVVNGEKLLVMREEDITGVLLEDE